MTTTHEPTRHRDPTTAWRYWIALLAAGLLASVAMVQTFGDVSAAPLENAPAVTPYDPQAAEPLPEVVAPVPFL